MNNSFTKNNWKSLFTAIEEENVIPVIGIEMYKYRADDNLLVLDDYLSQQLLTEYEVPNDQQLTLAQTINYLVIDNQIDIDDIRITLKKIVEKIDFQFPLLNELMKIHQIKYYVNTTLYDTILYKIIEAVRRQEPLSESFTLDERLDDFSVEKTTVPFVFNVFGSLKNDMYPALTEEEMLEFTALFQARMSVTASKILEALTTKTLLFIGCTQQEWLIRFFLRVLSNQRMNKWPLLRRKIIVVNDACDYRKKQYDFLKKYEAVTYEGNTSEFVEELLKRWESYPFEGPEKLVFISYAREDIAAVENLKKKFEGIKGLTFWHDKERLQSGNDWGKEIEVNINKSALFIPLISKNCIGESYRYVLKEWIQGTGKNSMINNSGIGDELKGKYLMPIVIDDADLSNRDIRLYYEKINIERAPDGNVSDDFIKNLRLNLHLI